jgi:hypothetical protein
MSRTRLIIAGTTLVALAVLLGWQYKRERMVRACLEVGGVWNGRLSVCRYQRPVLQRDLHRS